jgi:hypothetical protein
MATNLAVLEIGSDQKFILTHANSSATATVTTNHRLAFGNALDYIKGDGSDIHMVGSQDVILDAGRNVISNAHLIPGSDNANDLGISGTEWRDVYLQGDIKAADAMEVTTALGVLTIDGKTGVDIQEDGTSVIGIDTSKNMTLAGGTFDVNATGLVSIDSTGGVIDIGVTDHNNNINIGTDGTRTITIGEAANSTVTIKSKGGTLLLDGTGQTVDINSANLDIDASGTIDIDGASTITIGGSTATELLLGKAAGTVKIVGDLIVDGATVTMDAVNLVVKDKTMVLGLAGGEKGPLSVSDAVAGVITSTGHGFSNDNVIYVYGHTGSTIAEGLYEVKNKNINDFQIEAIAGGGIINTSAESGVTTVYHSGVVVSEATATGSGIEVPGASLHSVKYHQTHGWQFSDDIDLSASGKLSVAGTDILSELLSLAPMLIPVSLSIRSLRSMMLMLLTMSMQDSLQPALKVEPLQRW